MFKVAASATLGGSWGAMGWKQGTSATARARAFGLLFGVLFALVTFALAFGPSSATAVTTVKLRLLMVGEGKVHLSPSGDLSECTKTCEVEFPVEEEVTVTEEPALGWTFRGWTACPELKSATECAVTMDAEKLIGLTFTNAPYAPVIESPAENERIESPGGPVEVNLVFEDNDSTITEFHCKLDEGAPVPCSPPEWVISSVGVGHHTAYVYAVDGEGHESFQFRNFEVFVRSPEGGGGGSSSPPPEFIFGSGGGGGSRMIPVTSLLSRWKVKGRLTWVRKLVLGKLLAGDSVVTRCKGDGCRFTKKKLTAGGGTLNLTRLFGKHPLGAGAVVRISVVTPGAGSQSFDVRIRARKQPKVVRR